MGAVFTAFQRSKIRRVIRANNKRYLVTRYKRNDYGELTSEMDKHFLVHGLFHDRQGFVQVDEKDGSSIKRTTTPMLLVLSDDFDFNPIKFEDVVQVSYNKYRVLSIENLGEAGFAYDISMELIKQ